MAEQKNRSIVGAARAMLHDQSLPFFLWAEACSTAIYVLNRSPYCALGSKTPKDTFTGKVPEIGHFQIFGCLTYSHVPYEKRTKLEATCECGIFVGYDETSKALRIYLPEQRRVVVRREVKFEEEKVFRRSLDFEMEDQQGTTQATTHISASQSSGSPVSGVTGSQVTGSSVIRAQSIGTYGTGTGSQMTPSGDSSSSGTGTGSIGTCSQVVGTSSGRQVSDEEVEESLR